MNVESCFRIAAALEYGGEYHGVCAVEVVDAQTAARFARKFAKFERERESLSFHFHSRNIEGEEVTRERENARTPS